MTRGWTVKALASIGRDHNGQPLPPKSKGRSSCAAILVDREDQRRESELQREVEQWLAGELSACRLLCWTHVRTPRKDRPGLPDLILGLREGLVCAIEMKRPSGTGRLRPEQRVWLAAWGDRGAVCTSLAQVVERVREWRKA